jgi:integration host factor subunit beta
MHTPGAVEAAVTCILAHMITALARGKRIEIGDLGNFALHLKPHRTGRNPKTGEHLQLPAKVVVHFKPGEDLKDRANNTA